MICYVIAGACGFGEYGRTVNDGSVAGVSRLWKNGSGCGACYQVTKESFMKQNIYIRKVLPLSTNDCLFTKVNISDDDDDTG